MDWSVLFIGPPGAGKTGAIAAVSDIEVVRTEAASSERLAPGKSHTTVAMDVGAVSLGDGERLRLVGAPGQPRFDFMWDILLPSAAGIVVLVDRSRPDPAADLAYYVGQARSRGGAVRKPMIKMARRYATNSTVGMHLSCWDITETESANRGLQACIRYYKSLGADAGDFLVGDVTDRDAGWAIRPENYGWDKGHYYSWDDKYFDQFLALVKAVTEGVGKPMILWQIPLGNENMVGR